ncbi:gamma carbonic anhydrase family protein [Psychroflexus sp. CAK57W]|uniref:gamma carbonic anhydrase family protein n=1 Tax=Psychroflexus curvus TaxID=2873595 RepID=UPI001CCBF53D|nr:gamma carbonic anhydrase family protein [Psychroflexus curvus]MBZ9626767.1 gamma carbonic anhydrase family protein [Psychroflexus curvus]MBZ9786542.1 gamma carbonic anhydrase family protein [Psychroflexus curvus]
MALIQSIKGISPQLPSSCFLAENSTLVGDVKLGENCSIWYNAVVRGDVNSIEIGDETNIQDGAIIHCTYQKASTKIGNRVSIGHKAIVHGCTIHDDVLIGMGAIVMDHAVIESGSIVAAGAIVTAGTRVEAHSIFAGIPAKRLKTVSEDNLEMIKRTAKNYTLYKTWID